ncbi:MAG: 2-dehydropantoate 2-reductase [Lachnospiraceae bacterium]|nr:2-dehydropantoate 2-reductase [Lachnospiraceae bacterium]
MRIYVDFDDCLCETAKAFSELAVEMFDKHVPYENIRFFELDKSFDLDADQFERFMIKGHEPDVLLSYEETPGASKVINEWITQGHDVSIITGRPFSSYEPSRKWLDDHGLKDVKLYCLNKYGRDSFIKNSDFSLELEDYYKMKFDFAIEDSPKAFRFFDHLPDLKVLVFDRPWNRECTFPNDNYMRCFDWESIQKVYTELEKIARFSH